MVTYDVALDLSGLECPLPILRTKKALAAMAPGQIISVIATDPGSQKDFPAFARMTGHELLEASDQDGRFHFVLKKVPG